MKTLWYWLGFGPLIDWVRPSLQDKDGTASYRRLSALAFIALIVYMTISSKFETYAQLYAFYGLIAAFLLLAAVITADNIIMGLRTFRGANEPAPAPPEMTFKVEGEAKLQSE